MARVSKRKRPSKDVKVFKERIKVKDAVFDSFTLEIIYKLMSQGFIETLDFPIKRGKEAVVFRATPSKDYPTDYLAVKIYSVEAFEFNNIKEYIQNDPRFVIRKNRRKLIYEWVKKEYRNLMLCENMGISVPHPHTFKGNVLVMDFIGEDGVPAPTLKDHGPFDPKSDYEFLKSQLERMHKRGFVHADFSEYNVLCGPENTLYIVDLAQGITKQHPMFEEWYRRDMQNLERYFRKFLDSKKS